MIDVQAVASPRGIYLEVTYPDIQANIRTVLQFKLGEMEKLRTPLDFFIYLRDRANVHIKEYKKYAWMKRRKFARLKK